MPTKSLPLHAHEVRWLIDHGSAVIVWAVKHPSWGLLTVNDLGPNCPSVYHYPDGGVSEPTKIACPFGVIGDERTYIQKPPRGPRAAVCENAITGTVTVTALACKQVQEVTEEEARNAGYTGDCPVGNVRIYLKAPSQYHFANEWDRLNPKTPWASNPWVWVATVSRKDSRNAD